MHCGQRFERLCRYGLRPPISSERLSRHPDGRVLYRLKRRWRDGTTHFLFDPLDFLGKLAALVPPPRGHQVRYHGVLAPAARKRAAVVADRPSEHMGRVAEPMELFASDSRANPPPGGWLPEESAAQLGRPSSLDPVVIGPGIAGNGGSAAGTAGGQLRAPRARRLSWAELMQRIFAADVLECGRCQGRMRIVAMIDQPEVIAKILTHLGLPARAPPPKPARPDLQNSPEGIDTF